ncbi:hypothetical protein ACMWP7_23290, partial [Escherichia coli]
MLKREGRCPSDVEHRQIKYRNNVIECDHVLHVVEDFTQKPVCSFAVT